MCSQSCAPTSIGPGIADLPCVAVNPISFAYSGLMLAVWPVPMCHAPRNSTSNATDTIAARVESEEFMAALRPASRRLPDLEAVQVLLGLGRIEHLAHHREGFG